MLIELHISLFLDLRQFVDELPEVQGYFGVPNKKVSYFDDE